VHFGKKEGVSFFFLAGEKQVYTLKKRKKFCAAKTVYSLLKHIDLIHPTRE